MLRSEQAHVRSRPGGPFANKNFGTLPTMPDGLQQLEAHACFGGIQGTYQHHAQTLGVPMRFSAFVPKRDPSQQLPVMIYLSGLTCTEQNVTTKAGFQARASDLGMIVVCPDTSPRGEEVADDPAYDLGQGAGFYLDATEEPWKQHFRMETYLCQELLPLLASAFPVLPGATGITGHSMGGHGALTLALRHPELFRSVSAIAPIVAPTQCPWGQKAFSAYLGDNRGAWARHDACELLRARGRKLVETILIDQGDADPFLTRELMPERFAAVCAEVGQPLRLNMRPGYDHSYYFVATVIDSHINHHAVALLG